MRGLLKMSEKERDRKVVMERVLAEEMTIREASEILCLSYRHTRRVVKRYGEQGDWGLVHRSRGRRSNRALPEEFRQAVLRRYHERYEGFGPTFAVEKLAEDGFELDHETLRRWLKDENPHQWQRKRKKHRCHRPRKEHFGELVQLDGSHHRWFGEDKAQCCLMNMVDDATGRTMALLAEQETTEAAMRLLWQWIKKYGIPRALYTDRKNVFVTDRPATVDEQLDGEEPMTAFGKACRKLGIKIIKAYSPQAKGRVERKHQVFQDRFLKELYLQDVTTIEAANRMLRGGFVTELNRKFAVKPLSVTDYHHPLPKDIKLSEVFCFEEQRTVTNDWTIRYYNRFYQILRRNTPLPRPKAKVTVRRLLNGATQIVYKGKRLRFKKIKQPERKQETARTAPPQRKRWAPPADHPWRRGLPLAARGRSY